MIGNISGLGTFDLLPRCWLLAGIVFDKKNSVVESVIVSGINYLCLRSRWSRIPTTDAPTGGGKGGFKSDGLTEEGLPHPEQPSIQRRTRTHRSWADGVWKSPGKLARPSTNFGTYLTTVALQPGRRNWKRCVFTLLDFFLKFHCIRLYLFIYFFLLLIMSDHFGCVHSWSRLSG